ncbi:MAG TPA: hypothetical protein VML58_18780 [Burkholderiaceae bacterium]|nr:hypothetical protein [Burkholderiaceae bacterium]
MVLFRLVFGLLLLASLLCFAMYVATRAPVWRLRGVVVLKWTLIAAVGFFGVLVLERLPLFL